jgi:hypothetical protein
MDIGTGLALFGAKDLIIKLLGPTAEYLGKLTEAIAKKQIDNMSRIFYKAVKKLGNKLDEPGGVPPKILKGIFADGGFCEDEISAEYYGGVLASSRSGVSRDDRAVVLLSLLSRMSSYQIRSHYVFYSSLWKVHKGRELNIGVDIERGQLGTFIPTREYIAAMDFSSNESLSLILGHVLYGLNREGLIAAFSSPDYIPDKPENEPGITFFPMPIGLELYLFAHGISDQPIANIFKSNITIPIISGILLPEHPTRGEEPPIIIRSSRVNTTKGAKLDISIKGKA